jgi:hypothetical protein
MHPGKSANKHYPFEIWKAKIHECFNHPDFQPIQTVPSQCLVQQLVIKVKYQSVRPGQIGLLEYHSMGWILSFDSIEERLRLYYTGDIDRHIGQL